MKHSSSSSSFLTTIICFFSLQQVALVVEAGGGNTISVEPYLADWCAIQFADSIKTYNGYDHARLVKNRDYVRIEPYLGDYCFEQFPTELSALNKVDTLLKMKSGHHHYVQIEPYLRKWGDASFQGQLKSSSSQLISMEPYVANWCVKGQFKDQFGNAARASNSLAQAEANGHIKIETAFGKWCFAQFSKELATLNQDETIASLAKNHVAVENSLILWQSAEYNFEAHVLPKLTETNKTEKAILGLLVTFLIIGFIMMIVTCWRCKTAKDIENFGNQVAQAEAAVDHNLNA